MGMFKNHFDKICRDVITRFAKKYKAVETDMQILFYLKRITVGDIPQFDHEGNELYEDAYKVLLSHKVVEHPTTHQLLGVKVDFLGKTILISNQATMILVDLAEVHKVDNSAIRVMIYLDKTDKIIAHLYNGANPIAKVDLEELLDDQKLMQKQMQST